MNISQTEYCKNGLGKGTDDRCQCQLKSNNKRIVSGGPDIGAELLKEFNRPPAEPTLLIPDSIKTKEDLSEYLSMQYDRNSPEYRLFYAKYSQTLKFERDEYKY